jgi:hypothetical protein
MATTTPNFGWSVPTSTDLVKDGATAIETLGDSIDASMGDLLGGTSGQMLVKNSNTNMDFIWQTPNVGDITEVQAGTGISVASGTGPIPVITNTATTTIDAEGDLLVGDAADALQRLAIGSNTHVLTVDTSVDGKIKWAAPSGGLTLITRQTVSNAADTGSSFASVFTSTYDTYLVIIEGGGSSLNMLHMQLKNAGGNVTSSDYYGNSAYALYNASSFSFNNTNAAAAYNLLGATSADTRATIWINGVGNTSERATWSGNGFEGNNNRIYTFAGEITISDTFTGLNFKMASGNITLTAAIYGLAK